MNFGDLIDMRTALFFLAISNLMLAVLMASYAHTSHVDASHVDANHSRATALTWALARTLQSFALGLMCWRGILPDPMTVPLATSLLILGVSLESRAVVRYWQQQISTVYLVAIPTLAIFLIALSWLLQAPAGLRILIVSSSALLAIFPIAHIYSKRWRGATLLHRVITAATCLLLCSLIFTILNALSDRDNSVLSNGLPQIPTLVALLLFTIFNGFAFLLQMQQQTERQLRISEASLERAQNIAQICSWSIDFATGHLHRHGARGHEQSSIGDESAILTLFPNSPADEQPKLQSAWTRALQENTNFDLVHRILEKEEIRWLHSRAEFEVGADGEVLRVIGVSHDVTALCKTREALEHYQRHLEQLVEERSGELHEAEAQIRLILESTAESMLGFDTAGNITFANPSACAILGRAAEELVGKTARAALRCQQLVDADCPHDKCRLLSALYSGEATHHEDARFQHADGHFLPVSCSTQAMWRDGRIIGAVLSFVDITVQEQARQAREQALTEAQHLAKVRSEFIANMSHEIRTPLNGVLGLAQLGARDAAGTAACETFQRILNSGRHLLNVVNDILDFSRIEAGKLKLEDGSIVLGQLLDRVVELTATQAQHKNVVFRLEEALDLPRSCRGDALRLTQVLINLVGNAIKFTERGSVTLSVAQDARQIIFRIRDTGIGMHPEQLGHLFKAFEQGDGTTTRRFGGSGLGLVISQRLMHLMGGEIRVSSQPGVGSVFEVQLPLRDTTAAPFLTLTGRIHLVGIESVSARQLADQLQALGASPGICTLAEACASPAPLFVHSSILENSPALESIAIALERGMKPVIVTPAGTLPTLPAALRNASTTLEEPLRLRHLLAALSGRSAAPTAGSGPKQRLRGIRILVAEDNAVNQLVLEDMLLNEGADLVCVENGRQALEMVETRGEKAFDIVLTDIQMPEMDGYEAARCINALAPHLPLIGLTAHAMSDERARCLEAGMVEQVSKPLELELLVQTILQQVGAAARGLGTPAASENLADMIDWQALETQFGATDGVIEQLIDAILNSTSGIAAQLRQHATAGYLDQIAVLAHKLKGASANLKAFKLSRLADKTERAADAGLPNATELALELATATEKLRAELEKRKLA